MKCIKKKDELDYFVERKILRVYWASRDNSFSLWPLFPVILRYGTLVFKFIFQSKGVQKSTLLIETKYIFRKVPEYSSQ